MNVTTHGRQWPLVLEQVLDFTDLDAAPSALKPTLPQGAVVLSGGVFIETAFGTGAALAVGISGDTDLYAAGVDLASVAYVPFTTGLGIKAAGETIVLTPDAEAISATAGKARLVITYVIAGRATEVQPG